MIVLTEHAGQRLQQRSIPEMMLKLLMLYGEEKLQKGGTRVLRLPKDSQKALRKELKHVLNHLDSLSDSYMVLADDGVVITAGHNR